MDALSPQAAVRYLQAVLGAHLSIARGLHNAVLEAERLKCDTVQVFTGNPRSFQNVSVKFFTKNQQRGASRQPGPVEIARWKAECKRLGFTRTAAHGSYLLNLAGSEPNSWHKSVALLAEELRRCEALGIPYLVVHPGAHGGAGEMAGMKRVVEALNIVHSQIPRAKTLTCLECTAGQGTSIGWRLEYLAAMISAVKQPKRMGVCLDTAHLWAAGYDFRGRKYAAFMKHVDETVGLGKVKVIHLNDSKRPLGSRVDRHDHIGHGQIGLEGFRPFVRDPRFAKVPQVIETPKEIAPDGRSWDQVNIEMLRSLQ